MTIEIFAASVCKDLIYGLGKRGDRSFIVTTFTYPDGDHVPLYLDHAGGVPVLTDRGTTLFKCVEDGLDMKVVSRLDLISAVCASLGVEFANNALRKPVATERPGLDMVALLTAIARISNYQYDRETKSRPVIHQQVRRLLQSQVKPIKSVEPNFVYSDVDATAAFPVEFKVGDQSPRHIFTIQSAQKSNVVVATTQYLKAREHGAPTLAVIGSDVKLTVKDYERLSAVTRQIIKNGPEGHEDEIADFALAKAD